MVLFLKDFKKNNLWKNYLLKEKEEDLGKIQLLLFLRK
jgi:hypothetical protein